MKKLLFFLVSVVIFMGCKSGTTEKESAGKLLTMEEQIKSYEDYIAEHPEDHEHDSEKLLTAAQIVYKQRKFGDAEKYLKRALKNHLPASKSADVALFLGTLYKKTLGDTLSAASLYQNFLVAFPDNEKSPAIRRDYGNLPSFEERMKALSNEMVHKETGSLNIKAGKAFINSCELFAMLQPKNEKSPGYLLKATKVAKSFKLFDKALALFDWIIQRYPDTEIAQKAMFLKAFTYDNDLKQKDKAKTAYEAYIQKYPGTKFAEQAKLLIGMLGKSDEEIVKDFEKKK